MKVIKIESLKFASNCYLVYEEESRETIIIDPGLEPDQAIAKIDKLELKPKYIVLTHAHVDHILGVEEIKEHYDIPIATHREDDNMLKNSELNLSTAFRLGDIEIQADILLDDGDKLEFGGLTAKIIHTPGHTRGSMSINVEDALFTGDTLFAGSIGRSDFAGGSFEDIMDSIKNKLLVYPDETLIYPGHGLSSTVEKEKNSNPFVKGEFI